jgi:hypothetical protein
MVFGFLHILKLFHCYLQLDVVERVVSYSNPESYASGSGAAGMFSQARQVKRVGNRQ